MTPLAAASIAYPESFFSVEEVSGVRFRDLFRELVADVGDELVDVCRAIENLREMVAPLRSSTNLASDRREPGEGLILRRAHL